MNSFFRVCQQIHTNRKSCAIMDITPRTKSVQFTLVLWLLALVPIAFPVSANSGLRAFPGAEGAGALAEGGRGGVICEVTNLNDSGAGSLRACVEGTSGPRTVIFRVSGTIVLDSQIAIKNPYITIAGQTAPGGGIQITAKEPGTYPYDPEGPSKGFRQPLFAIGTHDVVIRYLRLRPGWTGEHDRGTSSGIRISTAYGSNIYNVIIDHLSINWWGANAVTAWDLNHADERPRTLRDITLQNSLMAENVYKDRFGMNYGSSPETYSTPDSSDTTGPAGTNMGDIDIHKNMLSTTAGRMPLIGLFTGKARVVNNIFYNGGAVAGVRNANPVRNGIEIDYIGNRWDNGPAGSAFSRWRAFEIAVEKNDTFPPSLHISGNWGNRHGYDNRAMATLAACAGCSQVDSDGNRLLPPVPDEYLRSGPLAPRHVEAPISVINVDKLDGELLATIGASRRVDCVGDWVFNRDSVDSRVINEGYLNRAQTFLVNHEEEVGGFPVVEKGEPCADSSGDGIPDAWLVRNNLDPREVIGSSPHESGYTFLELYLNGMQVNEALQMAPAAPPSGILVQ